MTNCYHQELTPLVVCKVKINNRLKTFEKTMTNKKVVHGLHKMFYFEREKHSCSIFTEFFCGNLSSAMFFFVLN